MSYVVALVPARAGSKGVPNKNIRSLAGHPLLAYSVRAGVKAGNIDRVIVSTDSAEYADIAKRYGAEAPFLRPAPFAGDRSSDYEFVAHALDWMEQHEKRLPDLIVHLRPTTPLREASRVAAAVTALGLDADATALRSVHEMSESAYKCFEIEEQRLKTVASGFFELDAANQARQLFPKTYHANGYVDVLKTAFIRAYGRIHGNRVTAFITPPVVEVDTEADFALIEYQASSNPAITNQLFA